MDAMNERIFRLAAEAMATMTGNPDADFQTVRQQVNAGEIVFAVWPDSSKASGFDFISVKGSAILEFMASSGVPEELVITAIPCNDVNQAEALRQMIAKRHGKL
jgi:hypothetical protein